MAEPEKKLATAMRNKRATGLEREPDKLEQS
jgi:hypothetical protein